MGKKKKNKKVGNRLAGFLIIAVGILVALNFIGASTLSLARLFNAGNSGRTFSLPEAAIGQSVISLGKAKDPQSGRVAEGFAFIKYKKGFHHRPDHAGGPGAGGPGGEDKGNNKCFALLAQGAKWKNVEPWFVNHTNSRGLSESFVLNNLSDDISKWESAATEDILGDGTSTLDTLVADTRSPDGLNEVYFADISGSGAIGVTIIWGFFSGPLKARELLEWDQIYNDFEFDWSSSGEAGKMDFENIATHELGHSAGMGHPDNTCTEETMYAFAELGETKKRTLNKGDRAGIKKLYR